jgi:hypothetical protein
MAESKQKDPNRIHSRHETSNEDIPGFTWGQGFHIQWNPVWPSEEGATFIAVLKALKDRLEFVTQELRPYGFPAPPNYKPPENEKTAALKHVKAALEALGE